MPYSNPPVTRSLGPRRRFCETGDVSGLSPLDDRSNPRGFNWDCPSRAEFRLVGYSLQKWIQKYATDILRLKENRFDEIQLTAEESENLLQDGQWAFNYEDKVYLYTASSNDNFHRISSDTGIAEILPDLEGYLKLANPLRKKHLQVIAEVGGNFSVEIRQTPDISMEDVIIDPKVKEDLIDNTVFHLKEIQGDNGMILHGPPGTGKSLTCQALIKETLAAGFSSCYVVGRIDFDSFNKLIERYLAPCLIVIEDIDTFATEAEHRRTTYLSDFLQFMSGLSERPEKIVVIATTNHVDKLDRAIIRRPVRFNRRYHLDFPNHEQMKQLLKNYFSDTEKLPRNAIDRCVNQRFAGAHIRELSRTSEILARKRNAPTELCFNEALEILSSQFPLKNRPLGFF